MVGVTDPDLPLLGVLIFLGLLNLFRKDHGNSLVF